MKTRLLIGTSGYSYKDWVGPVYPEGTAAKDYLKVYQSIFNFTELNFSYYKFPSAATLERLAHSTNDGFMFAIKAHRSITHEITMDYKDNIKRFIEAVKPLQYYSKLAAVLVQFPYSFHYTPESRKYLQSLCTLFIDLPLAIEFRNYEWQKQSVYQGLKGHNTAWVNTDMPALTGLPSASFLSTTHFSYYRFHGRNSSMWWKGDNASRYNYLYSTTELENSLFKIKKMAETSGDQTVIVAFNNHWKGKAVTNASQAKEMLGDL